MLEVRDLGVQKGGRRINRGINFKVRPGRLSAIVGANGAGKSTLLKAVTGTQPLTTGEVFLEDQPLTQYNPKNLAKLRAVLSQQNPVAFVMPTLKIVALGRYPYAKQETEQERLSIAYSCLTQVGMEAFAQRDIRTLSGGEQQRVQLARVLAQLTPFDDQQAKYLFLDEPTASQDMAQQHRLLGLLRHLSTKYSIAIIAVLHDLNLAAQYADQILMMKSGLLIADGTPMDVLTPTRIKQCFGINVKVQQHPTDCYPHILVQSTSTKNQLSSIA